MILVTGATGRHGGTGAHVVRRLREEGLAVRVLVRRRDDRVAPIEELGAEIVVGDLHDRAGLAPALEGVQQVYFTYPISRGVVEAAATLSSAICASGTRPRVVVMSMAAAQPDGPSRLGRAQWLAEEVMGWADLDLTILRIGALFYENLTLLHAPSIARESVFRNSFGAAAVPWLSGRDAAEIAVAALLHPERFGPERVRYLPGATLLDHAEVAHRMAATLGRPVQFQAVTRTVWQDELEARAAADPGSGVNNDMAAHISAVGAALAAAGQPLLAPDPSALRVLTDREPVPLEDFLAQHRADFDELRTTGTQSG